MITSPLLVVPPSVPLTFVPPAAVTARPRMTQRLPWLYPWAVRLFQLRRRWEWLRADTAWARTHSAELLPMRVKKHSSLLMRELSEQDMVLQRNKVMNLRLASARIDGLIIDL